MAFFINQNLEKCPSIGKMSQIPRKMSLIQEKCPSTTFSLLIKD